MLPQAQQAAERISEPAGSYESAISLVIRSNQEMDPADPQLGENPGRIGYHVS